MSVNRRSSGVAGRPQGRPAATTLGKGGKWSAGRRPALPALVTLLAIGACTAVLTPSPVAAQGEGEQAAPAPDNPVPPPAQPTPATPPFVQAEESQPAAPVEPPRWNPTATYHGPGSVGTGSSGVTATAPETNATAAPAPAEPPAAEPAPEPQPEEPAQPGPAVGARNQSTVFQAIWQEQVGCRSHCRATSQAQSATQASDTTQEATAVAPAGQSSGAAAVNQSSTVQFIWQAQLGCVAFCWSTVMDQSASQDARTTQMAMAVGDFGALAQNLAQTLQYVWQFQEGCQVECYDVGESQSLSQSQTTTQSATARGPEYPASAGWRPDSADSFFAWVTAFAESVGATVQTIFQHQKADCLEQCGEEALLQAAGQQASTEQRSTAGAVPEPVVEPPTGSEPPAAAQEPGAAGPPPFAAPQSTAPTATATAAASEAVGDSRRHVASHERGDRAVQAMETRAQSATGSSHSSVEGSAGATRVAAPHTTSATDAAAAPPGSGGSTATATNAPDSPASTGSPTSDALDPSAATEARNDPEIPWLAVLLLTVAAVAVIQSLRLRPGFGA